MRVVVNHVRVKRETTEIHNRMGIPVKRPSIVRATRPKPGGFGTGCLIAAIRKRLPFCLNSKKSGQKRRKQRLPVAASRVAFQRRQNGDGSGRYKAQ